MRTQATDNAASDKNVQFTPVKDAYNLRLCGVWAGSGCSMYS